jgi:excisionase family DNA binding protein
MMERLLTIGEVADQLAVPEASLRFWRHTGTGPPSIKVGRHVRYRQSDIDKWLSANASPTPAGAA